MRYYINNPISEEYKKKSRGRCGIHKWLELSHDVICPSSQKPNERKLTHENTHTHTHIFFEVVTSNWAFQDSEKEQVEQFCSRLYLLISRWRMFLIFCTVISGGTIQPKKKNLRVSSTLVSLQLRHLISIVVIRRSSHMRDWEGLVSESNELGPEGGWTWSVSLWKKEDE